MQREPQSSIGGASSTLPTIAAGLLGMLPPLDLAQAVTMERVLHAGALLADGHRP
jgi:hypothetical protein